jgi:hypothetical protein
MVKGENTEEVKLVGVMALLCAVGGLFLERVWSWR